MWRRLARAGRLGADDEAVMFAQAVIGCEPAMTGPPSSFLEHLRAAENPSYQPSAVMLGRMEIVLGPGRCVIVDKDVDAVALARIIDVLERR